MSTTLETLEATYAMKVTESVISASLNAGMLNNFLMGIYTMVYGGTMYTYISKRPANRGRSIILLTVSLLYLLCMGDFIIQWYYLDLAIVTDGKTRKSIFVSTLESGPLWIYVLDNFLLSSVFVVSDGLLIWRCYHAWGMSIRVILVPLVLLLAETGLLAVVTVMSALFNSLSSEAVVDAESGIASAQIFVSLATTIISTFLIAYKIHSTSRHSQVSRRQFAHVVIVVTESAAVYSLAMLIYALTQGLPSSNDIGSPLYNGAYYLQSLVTAVGGMAPTILVARIALTSPDNTVVQTMTHISGLQFQSQQGSGRGGSTNGAEVNSSIQENGVAPQDEEKMM